MLKTSSTFGNNFIATIRGFKERIPYQAGVVLLALLAVGMRLPTLAGRSPWYDEAFSILFSREGPTAMLYGTLTPVDGAAADVHPLLYYSALWLWMSLFGQSIVAVRSLSILLSVVLLLCITALSRRLFNPRVSLVCGFLFAISPFQIHHGQEARMYVLLALLLVLSTSSLLIALETKNRAYIVFFGITSALAMYTHVLAIFFLIPLALTTLLQRFSKSSLIILLTGSFLGAILYAPWLMQLPAQIFKVQQAYWIERPGLEALLQTFIAFSGDLPIREGLLPIMLLATLLLFAFVVMEAFWFAKNQVAARSEGLLVLSLAFFPVLLLFAVSQVRPLFIVRGLLPSGVFYLLAISSLLIKGRRLSSWTMVVGLSLSFIVGGISHYSYAGFPYAPYKALNQYLGEEVHSDSVVLHSNKISMLPAYYDDPALPHKYLQDPPGSASDTLAYPTQEVLGLFAEKDALSAAGEADEVFFVVFKQEIDDYLRLGYSTHPTIQTLEKSYAKRNTLMWGDLLLYTLERTE